MAPVWYSMYMKSKWHQLKARLFNLLAPVRFWFIAHTS